MRIAYPQANAEVELAAMEGQAEKMPVVLKAEGGTLPLTWLADGVPLPSSPHRRDAFLSRPGQGSCTSPWSMRMAARTARRSGFAEEICWGGLMA